MKISRRVDSITGLPLDPIACYEWDLIEKFKLNLSFTEYMKFQQFICEVEKEIDVLIKARANMSGRRKQKFSPETRRELRQKLEDKQNERWALEFLLSLYKHAGWAKRAEEERRRRRFPWTR